MQQANMLGFTIHSIRVPPWYVAKPPLLRARDAEVWREGICSIADGPLPSAVTRFPSVTPQYIRRICLNKLSLDGFITAPTIWSDLASFASGTTPDRQRRRCQTMRHLLATTRTGHWDTHNSDSHFEILSELGFPFVERMS